MGSCFPSFRKPYLVQREKLPPVSDSGADDRWRTWGKGNSFGGSGCSSLGTEGGLG